jgi:chitin disaccharide deacetylase
MLIVNADDWGKNKTTTDNSLLCFKNERITSASAMVFMYDSQRAAELALEYNFEVGLHLNFTTRFNHNTTSSELLERHRRIATFLQKNKYCFLLYNPVIKNDFHYVFNAQYDEYVRLYHKRPTHIDGHHHMHLCTNVLLQRLIPKNSRVRRNFSFTVGEKSRANQLYRSLVDRWLLRRYQCTDFFFSIEPMLKTDRLHRIINLSLVHTVELMVHPEKQNEFNYLLSPAYQEITRNTKIRSYRTAL